MTASSAPRSGGHRAHSTRVSPTFPRGTLSGLVIGPLVVATAACGGSGGDAAEGSADGWSGEVRDSAGIEIVVNPGEGLWRDGPGVRLEETFRVGGMNAPTEAMFGQVVGIDTDSAGNVYVADQQASQIQVFSPDGDFLRTLGEPGSGPGEIGQAMAGVFVVGDEVWSPDPANARINRWKLDGALETALRLDLQQGVPVRWDEVGDAMVAQFRDISQMIAAQQGQDIPEAEGDVIRTVGGDGADTLLSIPRGMSFSMSGGQPRLRIFEAEPIWDATPAGAIVTGMNDDIRLRVHDADGTLKRIVVLQGEAPPVTEADQVLVKDAMRGLMQQQGAPPQAVEPLLAQMEFAARYPRFAQVVVGPDGSLWLQQILTAEGVVEDGALDLQNLGSDDWYIFDPRGRYLGEFAMPHHFQPLRMIGDVVWGVQRDEFDVPAVVGYRVIAE